MEENKDSIIGIHDTISILKFLIFHDIEYRKVILSKLYKSAIVLGALLSFVLVYDLQKLSPTGQLSPLFQSIIRWASISLLSLLFVAYLAFYTKPYVKKWRNFHGLSSKELKQFIEYLQNK